MIRVGNKKPVFLICVVLALVTFVAFEQVRHNDFVNYDDGTYVTENRHIQTGITYESVKLAFTTMHPSGNWHPLTSLSHMLDCQFFGLNPAWHHMTSLLIHILNTLLLFWVLHQMTGTIWRSAFVAAAFALHPLHVESVAWVAERKDVLSGFFFMLTILAYNRYTERPCFGRYLFVLLSFCLGLMAKPMLVTLPFVLLLLDYWPLSRFPRPRQNKDDTLLQAESVTDYNRGSSVWRLIAEKIPLFALAVASSVVTFIVQNKAKSVWGTEILSLNSRIGNALVSYIKYIGKMIFPTRLSVLYPYSKNGFAAWQLIVCILILAVVSAFVIYIARRKDYLLVGWLWFIGTLVPVIGLVQVGAQSMADRYTYLPSIGIFIMVVWGAVELGTKWRYGRFGLATLAAVSLAALLICTRTQVRYWQSSLTLCKHALEVTKDNFVMHINLGLALYSQGFVDEANSHYRQALQIKPGSPKAHNNLAVLLIEQGALEEAIKHCRQALRFRPDFAEAHSNLGNALAKDGKLDEAIEHFNQALKIKPDHFEAHNNLGFIMFQEGKFAEAATYYKTALEIGPPIAQIHFVLGKAQAAEGKLTEAIESCTASLNLEPDRPGVHQFTGESFLKLGETEKAVSHYEEAIRLNPKLAVVRNRLGEIYYQQGEFEKALVHWNEALEIKPDWVGVLNNIAWVKAAYEDKKFHDPKAAIRFAQKACELTGYTRPALLHTLSVAYAADGRFDEAIETAEKAMSQAEALNKQQLTNEIQRHLELFRLGQPYYDSAQPGKKQEP
jgi:tetratricopeptide (TPR) repeat protein